MKNQQGIIWAPIMIIVATVVVAGIAGYFLFKAGNTKETENQNVAVVNLANNNTTANLNTPTATNTNQVANNNASVNTNTAADPTAGWKTYTNEAFHYTVKYPTDYQPGGTVDSYYFQKGDITGPIRRLSILSLTSANHTNLEQSEFSGGYGWYDWAMAGFPNNSKGPAKYSINKHEEKIGANTFTVFNYDPGSSWGGAPFYYLVKGETVFLFTDQITGSSSSTLAKDILDTFTIADPTAGWKTFTNEKYSYSLRLATDWKPLSEFDGSVITGPTYNGNSYLFGKLESRGTFGFTISAFTMSSVVEGYPNSLKQWRENKNIKTEQTVSLGSTTFTKVTLQDDPTIWYLTEHGLYFYEIRDQEANNSTLNQMLSTFQFSN